MTLVVDASVALTWCFEDERSPNTDDIGQRVASEGAIVPALFHLELGNALLMAVRRRRISFDGLSQILGLIAALPIAADDQTANQAWRNTLLLARDEQLTVYDASYLELALRFEIPLATIDRDLAGAARRRRISVLP